MTAETKVAELPAKWRAEARIYDARAREKGSTTPAGQWFLGCANQARINADELEDALAWQLPSYEALDIIVRSVAGALERAGVTECDDPGEAIDVLVQGYERSLARQEAVGWAYRCNPDGWNGRNDLPPIASLGERDDSNPCWIPDYPLYAAPPAAQAVDLSIFRDAVEYAHDYGSERKRPERARLLSIIDQQAGKADADSSEAPLLQRLRAEQRELADRHQKLEAFMTSPEFKSLDETNQMLLRRQENQQHNLLETLNQRIHHVAGRQGGKGVDRG